MRSTHGRIHAAYLGLVLAYSGEWERGCALAERAGELIRTTPDGIGLRPAFDAYRKGDYRGALHFALKVNMPGYWQTHLSLATAYAQLGEPQAAASAVRDLLAVRPDFATQAPEILNHRWQPELAEHLIEGLRKAGLQVESTGTLYPEPLRGAACAVCATIVWPRAHMRLTNPHSEESLCYAIAGRFLPKPVACSNACAICRTLKSACGGRRSARRPAGLPA